MPCTFRPSPHVAGRGPAWRSPAASVARRRLVPARLGSPPGPQSSLAPLNLRSPVYPATPGQPTAPSPPAAGYSGVAGEDRGGNWRRASTPTASGGSSRRKQPMSGLSSGEALSRARRSSGSVMPCWRAGYPSRAGSHRRRTGCRWRGRNWRNRGSAAMLEASNPGGYWFLLSVKGRLGGCAGSPAIPRSSSSDWKSWPPTNWVGSPAVLYPGWRSSAPSLKGPVL
jgi:hypothetical protein